jgi:hypothetical protein
MLNLRPRYYLQYNQHKEKHVFVQVVAEEKSSFFTKKQEKFIFYHNDDWPFTSTTHYNILMNFT